jgi:hypothetical protein
MEKVNLACCESGIQEVAGRAVIIALSSFFGVKKVDEQACEQENEEKSQVEKLYPLCTHIILYAVFII